MKEKLLNDLKEAMKNKDQLKKDTIMMLRSAILQIEKDEQKSLTESEMESIVSKEIKKRRDAKIEFEKAERQDIVENLNKEIEILKEYQPEQLSEEEIKLLVKEAINNTNANGAKDMGKVMQNLKDKIIGKADGKIVSDIVKLMLG